MSFRGVNFSQGEIKKPLIDRGSKDKKVSKKIKKLIHP